MRFGPTPLDEALGAILVHSLRLEDGAVKKGTILADADIARLRAAGFETVVTARPDPDDVGEDAAAAQIAKAAAGDGAQPGEAFTGRCNLTAAVHGVTLVDRARLDALNLVDEAVTVATVAPFAVAQPGQMLATIKIIPFAVPAPVLAKARTVIEDGGPLVSVVPFASHAVGLVMTRLPGTRDRLLDSTEAATRTRVEALGSKLTAVERCDHDSDAIAAAIRRLRDAGCRPILVSGASATVDRRDVAPAGIVAAGGEIVHFGMPVDPGNLILLARIGDDPVLVLPGCARSPKENGFDWVLQRLLADLPVGPADIMAMGSGGFLKDIPSRPSPRRRRRAAAQGKRIAAVVLAAGQSRRMGALNKLTAEVGGKPMLRHAVDAALASAAGPVIVVAGHDPDAVRAALGDAPVTVTDNPDYAEGLSTSLRTGIAAAANLDPAVDGALVLLGDMPSVAASDLDRLIAAFDPDEGRAICVPTYRGKRGNPVLWGRDFFDGMRRLSGDVGAKHLIGENAERVQEVPMASDAVLSDIDTPAALAAATAEKAG